jgi:hypothetical protein
MSHSPNGHLIREYFVNLHRAITEYVDYQRDYENMVTMKFKDDKIDLLSKKIDKQTEMLERQSRDMKHQIEQLERQNGQMELQNETIKRQTGQLEVQNEMIERQSGQLELQKGQMELQNGMIERQSRNMETLLDFSKDSSNKLNRVMSVVENTKDKVVVPAYNDLLQEIVIIMISEDRELYVVSCIQKRSRKSTIRDNKTKHVSRNLSVLVELESRPNSKNLWHRFKDYIVQNGLSDQIRISTSSFTLKDYTVIAPSEIVSIFTQLRKSHEEQLSVLIK